MLKLRTKTTTQKIDVNFGGDTVTVEVEPLGISELDALRRKHTKTKRGVEKPEDVKMYYDIVDKTIISWTGVFDEDEKVIECTRERKIELIDNPLTSAFIDKIMDEVRELQESIETRRESEKKT